MTVLERTGSVSLNIPADYGYLKLVRLAFATLASDLTFELDEVEAIRSAADELVTLLIGATDAHETVTIDVTRTHDTLSATGRVDVLGDPIPPSPVVQAVLQASTTTWSVQEHEDQLTFWFSCVAGRIGSQA